MMERTLAVAIVVGGLLLAGCQQPAAPDTRTPENSEKYSRDRSLCESQVDEYMRTRRRVDDASRETFSGDTERAGRDGLATQMANYGDSRNADKFLASCMEARGWPRARTSWWQRIGG